MSRRPRSTPRPARRPLCARARPGEAGFTLVEILLALLLFLTGVSGLYALLSTGVGMQREGVAVGRGVRRLEAVVLRLQQEIAEGQHLDEDAGGWVDIPAARLEDGTVYSVDFVADPARPTRGPLRALVRLAGREEDLDLVPPVGFVLDPGPTLGHAVRSWRRASRPAPEELR